MFVVFMKARLLYIMCKKRSPKSYHFSYGGNQPIQNVCLWLYTNNQYNAG